MQSMIGLPSRAMKMGAVIQSMPWLFKMGTAIPARKPPGQAVAAAVAAPDTKITRLSAWPSRKANCGTDICEDQ